MQTVVRALQASLYLLQQNVHALTRVALICPTCGKWTWHRIKSARHLLPEMAMEYVTWHMCAGQECPMNCIGETCPATLDAKTLENDEDLLAATHLSAVSGCVSCGSCTSWNQGCCSASSAEMRFLGLYTSILESKSSPSSSRVGDSCKSGEFE